MNSPFNDNIAVPLTGLALSDICPRAGILNPAAYNALEADSSLVGEGISPGDEVYTLSTADVVSGDLAAILTPDGLFVRLIRWTAGRDGLKIHLKAANPEIAEVVYPYDDHTVRTRWRAVWVCRHGDHGNCFAYRQKERAW